jgi:predicted metal-dependent hydrolase
MMQLEFALEEAQSRQEQRAAQGLRQLALPGGTLWFGFVRARRRTLTIVVQRGRVEVRSPRWTPIADVEAFLREKERWIRRRMEEARREPPRLSWREGERLPVLGEQLRITLRNDAAGVRRGEDCIEVCWSPGASPAMLRASVLEWLFAQAREVFRERVGLYAPRLKVKEPEVRLSNARTQWGSCSAHGRVLLNWRLIHVPVRLIDYVVAHELAHLKELNHSRRFWALVESVYPDCRAARRELNRLEKQLPEI